MAVNPVLLELPDLVGLREQAESLILPTNDKVSLTGYGDKKSPFRSRGLDFQEVRVYQPGDDIRQIDWRVTAKYGEPFTKLYAEEKEQQIYLVCDLRPASVVIDGFCNEAQLGQFFADHQYRPALFLKPCH